MKKGKLEELDMVMRQLVDRLKLPTMVVLWQHDDVRLHSDLSRGHLARKCYLKNGIRLRINV